MVQSQFSLSWESYKSNICSGFSALQQNGELVDMTLAADGHYVKVHQVLMALVSPYLKELITSAPCQHPVIFLNNVSYSTLCALLEYIYTGEVHVPSESLSSFVETAKNLHIKGLEELKNDNTAYQVVDSKPLFEDGAICHISGIKRVGLPSDRGSGEVGLPASARKIYIKQDRLKNKAEEPKQDTQMALPDDSHDFTEMLDETMDQDSEDDMTSFGKNSEIAAKDVKEMKDSASNVQYSVSIRGALQIILNRYIYNLFSTSSRNGIRRWRCVEYRNHRCKAYVVTKGNVVLNRGNLHNHPFHDKKILQKIEKKSVFSAIEEVEIYKEKEFDTTNEESSKNNEGTVTLELSFSSKT